MFVACVADGDLSQAQDFFLGDVRYRSKGNIQELDTKRCLDVCTSMICKSTYVLRQREGWELQRKTRNAQKSQENSIQQLKLTKQIMSNGDRVPVQERVRGKTHRLLIHVILKRFAHNG